MALDAAVAVTPHHLATEAALAIMERGGNAVDAAVAANAVLGVVAPETCGIGGDLFTLVHRPGDDRPVALNASGRAGSGATAETIRSNGATVIPVDSPWSVTVPGCIDGWEALLGELGTMSLVHVLAPAIEHAFDGFEVSPELADTLARHERHLIAQAVAPHVYPEGRPPQPGTTIRRPDLGETLRRIGDDGRDAFYAGPVGAAITEATEGVLVPTDLAQPQADWIDPLGVDVFGHSAWTIPPNSQGYIALGALWILERLDPPRDAGDPAYAHAAIEAFRAMAWDRDELVADPATAPLDPDELVSPARLAERVGAIRPDTVAVWPASGAAPGGTAFFCARDRTGMGVSIIQSNYHDIGSGRIAGDSGVFLHDRGAGFNLRAGHPNEYEPGRRPLHTLSPTLWTRGNRLALLLGTRGGRYQPQFLTQVAAHLFIAGDEPGVAQSRPRWLVEASGAGATTDVRVESRAPNALLGGLAERGHAVSPAPPWVGSWGPVSMIRVGVDGLEAAADPRVATASVGTV